MNKKEFSDKLTFFGNISERAMAQGKEEIFKEVQENISGKRIGNGNRILKKYF